LTRTRGTRLGEKCLWYKRTAFELSARVPLIIAGPGITAGGVVTEPVELLDLYPTLSDLCALEAPANLNGLSLRPLLGDPTDADDEWTKPALTQIWHKANSYGYSLRTERWRYCEWLGGEAGLELYDHSNDSGEVHTSLTTRPTQPSSRNSPLSSAPSFPTANPLRR